MSIGYERVPSSEGGGLDRVIGLYEGKDVIKDNLIIKARFGDKLPEAEEPDSGCVTGLMFRTVFLMALKVQAFVSWVVSSLNTLNRWPTFGVHKISMRMIWP